MSERPIFAVSLTISLSIALVTACGSSNGTTPGGGGATSSSMGGSTSATTKAATASTSSTGVGGASTSQSVGSGGAGGVVCPIAPPFDDSDAAILAQCTRPLIAAVGNGLRRATSYDGQTWDNDVWFPDPNLSDQNENSHRDVLVARGLIVIVGDGGILVSSDQGKTFATPIAMRLHDSAVAFFKGAFWVVSSAGTFTSPDGTTWQSWTDMAQVPGGLLGTYSAESIAVNDTTLVALDGRDTSYRIFDGTTWTGKPFDSTYGSLAKIAYGAGTFAIISSACCDQMMYAGLRATSPDGQTWTAVTNASPNAASYRFGDLIWDGMQFFATGSQYDNRGYVSPDGKSWTERTMSTAIGPVAVSAGAYVGSNNAMLYRSTDGMTWTMTHTGTGDASWGYTRIISGPVLKN